jgi:hypothetical protein
MLMTGVNSGSPAFKANDLEAGAIKLGQFVNFAPILGFVASGQGALEKWLVLEI